MFESLLGRVRNVSALPLPGFSPPSSPPSSPPRPASRSASNLKSRLAAAINAGALAPESASYSFQPVVFSTEAGFISGIVPVKKEAQQPQPESSRTLPRSRSTAAGAVFVQGALTLRALEEHAPATQAPDGAHLDGLDANSADRRSEPSDSVVPRGSTANGRRPGARHFFPDDGRCSPSTALPQWGLPLADMYIAPPPVGHVVTVSTRFLSVSSSVDSDDEEGPEPGGTTFVIAGSGNGTVHFFKYTPAAEGSGGR